METNSRVRGDFGSTNQRVRNHRGSGEPSPVRGRVRMHPLTRPLTGLGSPTHCFSAAQSTAVGGEEDCRINRIASRTWPSRNGLPMKPTILPESQCGENRGIVRVEVARHEYAGAGRVNRLAAG